MFMYNISDHLLGNWKFLAYSKQKIQFSFDIQLLN
jgi:hypothetical protein